MEDTKISTVIETKIGLGDMVDMAIDNRLDELEMKALDLTEKIEEQQSLLKESKLDLSIKYKNHPEIVKNLKLLKSFNLPDLVITQWTYVSSKIGETYYYKTLVNHDNGRHEPYLSDVSHSFVYNSSKTYRYTLSSRSENTKENYSFTGLFSIKMSRKQYETNVKKTKLILDKISKLNEELLIVSVEIFKLTNGSRREKSKIVRTIIGSIKEGRELLKLLNSNGKQNLKLTK